MTGNQRTSHFVCSAHCCVPERTKIKMTSLRPNRTMPATFFVQKPLVSHDYRHVPDLSASVTKRGTPRQGTPRQLSSAAANRRSRAGHSHCSCIDVTMGSRE
ncbi:hypothetical protein LSAT2_002338 [Lamellibrachia satsuma]|nr:hypothetical protein LSAT2_002338 [Lamellibrachia satsuma]